MGINSSKLFLAARDYRLGVQEGRIQEPAFQVLPEKDPRVAAVLSANKAARAETTALLRSGVQRVTG